MCRVGQRRTQDLKIKGAQDFFGQFKELFKEFGAKRGGRVPPPLDPCLLAAMLSPHKPPVGVSRLDQPL